MVTTKSQESSLIYRMLEDYYNTYMIARYSLDLSVVLAPDVQPVISAILQFLEFYNSRNKMHQRYTVNVSFFVSPSEPSIVLIVPKSLHGLCVLYASIADDGT